MLFATKCAEERMDGQGPRRERGWRWEEREGYIGEGYGAEKRAEEKKRLLKDEVEMQCEAGVSSIDAGLNKPSPLVSIQ